MKYRIAWKLFRRGRGGDLQRARGPVFRAWKRERDRFTAMGSVFPETGRPLRAPRLVRLIRGTKGSEIMWPEVVLFALPDCRSCWGFGMVSQQYCGCAMGAFTDAYVNRWYVNATRGLMCWRERMGPGQVAPMARDMRVWVRDFEEGDRVVKAKQGRIAGAIRGGDQRTMDSARMGHTMDIESYGDQARIARAKLIAGRLDIAAMSFEGLDVPPWPGASQSLDFLAAAGLDHLLNPQS